MWKRCWLLMLLALWLPAAAAADVVISEVMASNGTYESGHAYDWVELHNNGDKAVDLTGWTLSDSGKDPAKWAFPKGAKLKAGAYLTVYCTGDASHAPGKNATFYIMVSEKGETVTFNLNYDGAEAIVSAARKDKNINPIADPEREGYAFAGWFVDADCTVAYAPAAVTADTTVFAKWNAQKSGSSQYVFEAEMTNLIGKEGPGMSGAASGASMIVKDATGLDASNGKFVSYLYKQGLGLEFYLASSDAVTDAVLTLRVAGEMQNINLNAENYLIKVNGEAVDFSSVSLPSGGKFEDAIVVKNVTLVKGANVIELVTNNSVNPMGEGMGTYQGTAPMVDCIKLDTTAVVIWDANHQLPMQY